VTRAPAERRAVTVDWGSQSVSAPLISVLGLADRTNEARTACNQDMCAVEVEGKIHDPVKRK
jgi:hypothetical protein